MSKHAMNSQIRRLLPPSISGKENRVRKSQTDSAGHSVPTSGDSEAWPACAIVYTGSGDFPWEEETQVSRVSGSWRFGVVGGILCVVAVGVTCVVLWAVCL